MDDLLEFIKKTAISLPSVSRVTLFGSRARGDNNEKSDYDIAVFGADGSARLFFSDKADDFPTLHKVDIVYIGEKHRGTELYKNIIKDGIIIMDRFSHKLDNFRKAAARLEEGIAAACAENRDIIRDGVIQRFEFTAELSWKTVREYLILLGENDVNSPKPAMRSAFRAGLISDEQGWLCILEDRNASSHVYDKNEADEIFERIVSGHLPLIKELLGVLKEKSREI